jgi:hypothetical protein
MRTTNRILSALLGLCLIVAGLAVAIEMALIAAGRSPVVLPLDRWYQSLRSVSLDDGRFLVIAVAVGLIGLVLLVAELRPWPPTRVQANAAAGAPLSISRRSVERRVETAATTAGVSRARSEVRGKPTRWRLKLRAVGWPDRRDAVTDAVRAELARLYAPSDVPINVSLRRPQGRVR